jgi:hypothetical protein
VGVRGAVDASSSVAASAPIASVDTASGRAFALLEVLTISVSVVLLAEEPLFHLGGGTVQGLVEPHYHAPERVVVHGPQIGQGLRLYIEFPCYIAGVCAVRSRRSR